MERYKARHEFLPFIQHHKNEYNGVLPIWVAMEIFTFEMVGRFYHILPLKIKKSIAAEFGIPPYTLANWIRCIRTVRNTIAHNMRIYSTSLNIIPKSSHLFEQPTTHRIYDMLPIMKILLTNKSNWKYARMRINNLIKGNYDYINLEDIGFPSNWGKIL